MDLRDPITSSLAVIELPLRCLPNSAYHQPTTQIIPLSAAAARALRIKRQKQNSSSSSNRPDGSSQRVSSSPSMPASASYSTSTSSSSSGSGPAGSHRLQHEALEEFPWQHVWEYAAGNPSWWYKKHMAWHPDASQLFEGKEGHYKVRAGVQEIGGGRGSGCGEDQGASSRGAWGARV